MDANSNKKWALSSNMHLTKTRGYMLPDGSLIVGMEEVANMKDIPASIKLGSAVG